MPYRLLICLILFYFTPSFAHEPVKAEMITEQGSVQPGHEFWLAIQIKLDEHWHAYWKNPGDAGLAPEIDWQLPEGFIVEKVLWPAPQKYILNEMVSFGYENEATLLAKVRAPASISSEQNIKAEIRWVVCDESTCLPGSQLIEAKLTASQDEPVFLHQSFFEKARSLIPQHQEHSAIKNNNGSITLKLSLEGELIEAHFFPHDQESIDHKAEIAFSSPNSDSHYELVLQPLEENSNGAHLKGVAVVKTKKNDSISTSAYEIGTPISMPLKENASTYKGGLIFALLLAFAGGLLLNCMPCVLPVLSFKVLSFVKMSGQSKSLILKHAIAFSGGVLVSFWILAGVLLSLQAYGHAVGWGFQLQEPLFVGILASIIFIFGLSLFGVFEVGMSLASKAGQTQVSNKSSGILSSFFSGVLATAVATPCTGPFLGTAVGFAVTLPAIQAMLIFTFLGMGMAFPYLLLGAFPQFLKFVPKPGNWMIIFKETMGFLMLATVLWLIWVFGAQTDNFAVFLLLAGFFFMAIACWIYGKWATPIKRKTTRIIAWGCAGAFMFLGAYTLVFASSFSGKDTEATSLSDSLAWEKFSVERLKSLQEEGTPVFIDFTAKWCLICQANHLVLSSEAVNKKFEELGVVRMKADWTKNNSAITSELKKFGRNSVPLYLFYNGKGDTSPLILPQVLTAEIVLEHLI